MNELLHSRFIIGAATLVAVALSLLYYVIGIPDYPVYDAGVVQGWGVNWIKTPEGNLAAGVGLNLAIMTTLMLITRKYNLLRCNTKLPGALYIAMMLATPTLMICLYPGSLLAMAVLWCLWLIYSSYGDAYATRQIFLVFLAMSGLASVNYAFAVYLPIFFLGMAQMRVFTMRSILAALMGTATPWIIILGLGIVQPDQLQIPAIGSLLNPANSLMHNSMLGIAIFTAFLGLSAWLQGLMKMISYNAQSRAMLSLLWIVMLLTIVMGAIDYDHIALYLPVLNCCVVLEQGHLFGVIYRHGKSYIAILSIIGIYLLIYAWKIIIYIL